MRRDGDTLRFGTAMGEGLRRKNGRGGPRAANRRRGVCPKPYEVSSQPIGRYISSTRAEKNVSAYARLRAAHALVHPTSNLILQRLSLIAVSKFALPAFRISP